MSIPTAVAQRGLFAVAAFAVQDLGTCPADRLVAADLATAASRRADDAGIARPLEQKRKNTKSLEDDWGSTAEK